jgi:hypothetical protein
MADQAQIDQVRANLGDTDKVWFDDEALGLYLDQNAESVARATGAAIKNLALVAAMTGRSIKTDDLAIDSRQRGATLNEIAKSWFDQAASEDEAAASDIFDILPFAGADCLRLEAGLYPRYPVSQPRYTDPIYPS